MAKRKYVNKDTRVAGIYFSDGSAVYLKPGESHLTDGEVVRVDKRVTVKDVVEKILDKKTAEPDVKPKKTSILGKNINKDDKGDK